VHEATHRALRDAPPAADTALRHLYSETVDPTSARVFRRARFRGEPKTMVDLINATLREEMRAIPTSWSSARTWPIAAAKNLAEVKGKGGVFKVTGGPAARVRRRALLQRPIAEASIVGRAIGMAVRGLKPVAEIQFFDYIWPAMMQIRDELATMRWRSNGAFACAGGDPRADRRLSERRRDLSQPVRRSGIHPHSRPARGLPVERAGCLRLAAHRHPLGRPGAVPRAQEAVPRDVQPVAASGRGFHHSRSASAKVVKPGQNLTVITYGALVQKALLAATQVERRMAARQYRDHRSAQPGALRLGGHRSVGDRRPAA
jgi:2-oxoisovalerate dehydrogenase E1 component